MANMKEITATILTQFPNAIPCRTESMGNFFAVPGEMVDVEGVPTQTYYAVKASALMYKPTKTNPAFDPTAAHEAYEAHMAKQAEKASKPKVSKEPDPEKVAAKERRVAGLMEYIQSNPNVEFTSKDVFDALSEGVYAGCLIMAVGTDLTAIAQVDEKLVCRTEKGKKYWTYNA